MHVSSVLNDVVMNGLCRNEGVERTAASTQIKKLQAGPKIAYGGASVGTSGSTTTNNSLKEMAEAIQAIFSMVSMAINLFRTLFSPPAKPVFPAAPTPVAPATVTPFPVRPSPIRPSPISPGHSPGKKPNDIWGGFRQGPDGNCVTVSAIKAAMMKFGQKPSDIFKEVKTTGGGYEVVMRDGVEVKFSDAELQMAIRGSQFMGRDQEMLKDAHFLFAASAKRAQMENNDRTAARSFNQAIKTLNDGEYSREGLLRLGLKNHIKPVPLSDLLNGMIGTVERRGHSVAVIEGVEEDYGKRGRKPYQPHTITGLF
ncbi:hypothetical protein [Pseudomonas fluorescens]|uniref:hypothetical protein n=1 Tax=Pseudomonas fluorescens TaxID=294 RepID=UPI001BE5BEB8|nr:hypothetical protein [Pseudomonas fluorescens]MBT2373185.1 hypothetical protein [Pseudomonas fluorescens]